MDGSRAVVRKCRYISPNVTMIDCANMGISYSAPLRIEMHHVVTRNGTEITL